MTGVGMSVGLEAAGAERCVVAAAVGAVSTTDDLREGAWKGATAAAAALVDAGWKESW